MAVLHHKVIEKYSILIGYYTVEMINTITTILYLTFNTV